MKEINAARHRIIAAAVCEFGEKGYEKGSTNSVARAAHVSKGLIFKYFKDKLTLYLTALDFALDKYMEIYKSYALKLSCECDLLTKLASSTAIKLRISEAEPHISNLIIKSYMRSEDKIKQHLQIKISTQISIAFDVLFKGLDMSLFHSDLTKSQIIEYISIYSRIIEEKYRRDFSTDERTIKDLTERIYLDYNILLYGLYSR